MKTGKRSSKDPQPTLRHRAEKQLGETSPGQRRPNTDDDQELIHELQVHQIELEIQNEELLQAQKDSEASRDRFEDLFEFAPIGYFSLDKRYFINKANLTAAGMLGEDRSELTRNRISHYIFPEDQDIFYFHRKHLLTTSAPQHFDLRMKRKNGSIFYARLLMIVASNDTGEAPTYRIAVSDISALKEAENELQKYRDQLYSSELAQINERLRREVEERKQALEALKKSEERFRFLALNSTDMVSRHSLSGEILFVSPSCRFLLGYEPGELEGHLLTEFCHPDDLTELRKVQSGTLIHPGETAVTYRLKRNDGTYIWVETTSRLIRDEATGANLEIQASTRDVTLRKKAEDRLRQQSRELAILNQISADASKTLELDEILESIKINLTNISGIPAGRIYLYEQETHSFVLKQEWLQNETAHFHFIVPHPDNPTELIKNPVEFKRLPSLPRTNHHTANKNQIVWGTLRVSLIAQGVLQGVVILMVKITTGQMNVSAEIIRLLAHEVSIAIFNARLYQAELQSRHFAETLRNASLALSRLLDLDSVLDMLLDLMSQVVPFDRAVIYLYEDVSHISAHLGRGFEQVENLDKEYSLRQNAVNHPVIYETFKTRHSINLADVAADPQWQALAAIQGLCSWAGIPLAAGDKVIGFCGLEKCAPGFFNADHLRWAESLANQASVAIQNAWLFEQVRAGQERMQMLSRRLVESQENERSYVARELHDEAGQALVSLMLELGALKREANDPSAVLSHVKWLEENTGTVLQNLHNLAMDLRPATLEHLGLVAALRQHIEAVSEQNKIDIQFEALGMEKRLPKEIEVTIYRIATEAITNVVRHANATKIDILLERDSEKIVLLVEDNGVGFEQETAPGPDHMGLLGMRERAEMLGGNLAVESKPGSGTTVQLVFHFKNGEINYQSKSNGN